MAVEVGVHPCLGETVEAHDGLFQSVAVDARQRGEFGKAVGFYRDLLGHFVAGHDRAERVLGAGL